MKKPLIYIGQVVLGLLLLVIFAFIASFLFYMGALLLIIVLPPLLLFETVKDYYRERKAGKISGTPLFSRLWGATVLLTAVMITGAAILRVYLLGIYSFFPALDEFFQQFHQDLVYDAFSGRFGALFPYWLDFHWGLVGMATIFLFAWYDALRRNLLVREIRATPTSTARGVAIGWAELAGKVVALDPKVEYVARSWVKKTSGGHAPSTMLMPFLLDDGTGRILVNPEGCEVNDEGGFFRPSLHQVILGTQGKTKNYADRRLNVGDSVYVLGNVKPVDIEKEIENCPDDISMVMSPEKTSFVRMNFYDLFFISNMGEQAILDRLRKSITRGWGKVFVGMVISGWLSANAWVDIAQYTTGNRQAAPIALRWVAGKTLLDTPITVDGVDTRIAEEWLFELANDETPHYNEIMEALVAHQIAPIAFPLLREQSLKIDTTRFGAANIWLGKLDAMPAGQFGWEQFWMDKANQPEGAVIRMLLQFNAGEMKVSYLAGFGEADFPSNPVVQRDVEVYLQHEESGYEYTWSFPASVGLNKLERELLYENLLPGRYKIHVRPRVELESGAIYVGFQETRPISFTFESPTPSE